MYSDSRRTERDRDRGQVSLRLGQVPGQADGSDARLALLDDEVWIGVNVLPFAALVYCEKRERLTLAASRLLSGLV